MKISKITAIFILVLFMAVCNAAWAVTLEGTVFDPSGKVVPGARVSLHRSLIVVAEGQTDVQGVYRFEGLQEGHYQIAASARGLTSPSVEVAPGNSKVTTQDIHLKLSALTSRVVVSASLGGALVPEIGSSVSLVTRQEIGDRGVQNAFEAIRGIPGVEVNQAGRMGGVTGVFIRGGES
jgi:hypothetical protein